MGQPLQLVHHPGLPLLGAAGPRQLLWRGAVIEPILDWLDAAVSRRVWRRSTCALDVRAWPTTTLRGDFTSYRELGLTLVLWVEDEDTLSLKIARRPVLTLALHTGYHAVVLEEDRAIHWTVEPDSATPLAKQLPEVERMFRPAIFHLPHITQLVCLFSRALDEGELAILARLGVDAIRTLIHTASGFQ